MKRTWTIIGVRDVPGSFKWYRSLFGQPPSNTLTKPDRRDDVDRVPCCARNRFTSTVVASNRAIAT